METEWGTVQIKVARWPSGEVANASPEYEVCRSLAHTHKVPLKQVMQAAMRAWRIGIGCEEGRLLMDRAQIEALLTEVHTGR